MIKDKNAKNGRRYSILMLGVSLENRGGMAVVEKIILEHWNNDKFKVRLVVTHKDGSSLKKFLAFISGLIQYLLGLILYQPLIIYAHFAADVSFFRKSLFILIAKIFSKKAVIHSHSEFGTFYRRNPVIMQKYVRYILRLVDAIVVLDEQERVLFEEISDHNRCKVISNSIVCPKNIAPRDVKPLAVCTMGKLCYGKGTYDLLEAIPLVLHKFPEVEFLLCGDGDLAQVQRIIKNKGMSRNIKLLGYIDGQKKEDIYLRSAVYVMPSYHEGMPISLLEAMSYGLPVVATAVNGISKLIRDGLTGVLIKPGDIDALASKIIMLLKDDSLRTELGKSARASIMNNFNVETQVNGLAAIFNALN